MMMMMMMMMMMKKMKENNSNQYLTWASPRVKYHAVFTKRFSDPSNYILSTIIHKNVLDWLRNCVISVICHGKNVFFQSKPVLSAYSSNEWLLFSSVGLCRRSIRYPPDMNHRTYLQHIYNSTGLSDSLWTIKVLKSTRTSTQCGSTVVLYFMVNSYMETCM